MTSDRTWIQWVFAYAAHTRRHNMLRVARRRRRRKTVRSHWNTTEMASSCKMCTAFINGSFDYLYLVYYSFNAFCLPQYFHLNSPAWFKRPIQNRSLSASLSLSLSLLLTLGRVWLSRNYSPKLVSWFCSFSTSLSLSFTQCPEDSRRKL